MSLAGKASDSKLPLTENVSCKGCKWTGKSLRTHLNRTKSQCGQLYDMEALKKKSDELNKVKDAKRKYDKYHNSPEEAERKKSAVRKYGYDNRDEISNKKRVQYKQDIW